MYRLLLILLLVPFIMGQRTRVMVLQPTVAAGGGGGSITIGNITEDTGDISTTSDTLAIPSGCTDGDVLVAFYVHHDNDAVMTAPGDTTHPWVIITSDSTEGDPSLDGNGDNRTIGAFYKIITTCASETDSPYTFDWTADGAEGHAGGMVLLSGVDTTTPIDVTANWTVTTNSNTPSCDGVTTVTDNAEVFIFLASSTQSATEDTATEPSGTTELFEATSASGGAVSASVAYKTQATAGATGAFAWAATGDTNDDHSCYVMAFRPD